MEPHYILEYGEEGTMLARVELKRNANTSYAVMCVGESARPPGKGTPQIRLFR